MQEITPDIISKLQTFKNAYLGFKKTKDTVGMLTTLWDLGNYLRAIQVDKPHSFGWEIQRRGVFVKRPFLFRSYVIRRIWDSKKKMLAQVGGTSSVNDVFELFPFLDQKKWGVSASELDSLLNKLNSGNSELFRKALKDVKARYISISYDRKKHLVELDDFRSSFNKFLGLFSSETAFRDALLEDLGPDGVTELKNALLQIAKKEKPELRVLRGKPVKDPTARQFIDQVILVSGSKERVIRIPKVLDPTKLINLVELLVTSQKK